MSKLVNSIFKRVLVVDLRVRTYSARLSLDSDDETLHDLRINLRTLRSLLVPLRGLPGVDDLSQAAKAFGQLSGPMRELQVLTGELKEQGLNAAAATREQQLRQQLGQLQTSVELQRLLEALDAFPQPWLKAKRQGELRGLRHLVSGRLARQQRKLLRMLEAPIVDPHPLRLQVKRLRYCSEAYPGLHGIHYEEQRRLRKLQEKLGVWHDCWQWLAIAESETDLQPCVPNWTLRMHQAYQQAELMLEPLRQAILDN